MSMQEMMKRYAAAAEDIQQRPAVAPGVDVYENKDELLILADVPGVGREDLTVNLEKNRLTIEARRSEAVRGHAIAAEYRPLDFRRTFLVPQGIDAEKIVAELALGVLKVHLPKAAALRPRQIAIKAD